MSTQIPPRLWTVREVAEYLSVHQQTIYRKVAAGELPAIKLADTDRGSIRVSESDLTNWLREHAR